MEEDWGNSPYCCGWHSEIAGGGGKVMEGMGILLSPRQLGYGVRNGAEATIHAVRIYLQKADPSSVVVKWDFSNAFYSICRDRMLECSEVGP